MIIGYFKYKLDVNSKNLIGEFFNNDRNESVLPNLAERITEKLPTDDFEGIYLDNWVEDREIKSNLNIEKINSFYFLTWNSPNYFGKAFRNGDELIGFYTDDNKITIRI